MAWDPYKDRSIKFNNAIDACSEPYKILNSLKKQVQQLPITMFFQSVKKTSKKTPETHKIPPEDSEEGEVASQRICNSSHLLCSHIILAINWTAQLIHHHPQSTFINDEYPYTLHFT